MQINKPTNNHVINHTCKQELRNKYGRKQTNKQEQNT